MRYIALPIALLALATAPASPIPPTPELGLSFEQRVAAQEAIERIAHAHQLGEIRPFAVAVPRTHLEKKVRTYLRQSAALEKFWNTPVTAEALERELRRIIRRTRLPQRLGEIFGALHHDAILIQECYVRPILVERLTRSFSAPVRGDRSFDEWWAGAGGALDDTHVRAVAAPLPSSLLQGAGSAAGCLADDTWAEGSLGDDPDARYFHTSVWTGSSMIVWGGLTEQPPTQTGSRYEPATDSWMPTSTVGAPTGRFWHTAVWTGTEMIVWGGYGTANVNTGGRYDPSTDTWKPTSTVDAPVARIGHSAIWTGSEMIVWGGADADGNQLDTGGRYDPSTDTWAATTTTDAPPGRGLHTAVWSGSEMIVWGGGANAGFGSYQNTGGRYDPVADRWRPTTTVGAPDARQWHTAVWADGRMIVWGGEDELLNLPNTGGRYDPVTDAWEPTSTDNAPAGRQYPAGVWTGSVMVLWGGFNGEPEPLRGGRYDPVADSWTLTSEVDAPPGRWIHTAVWTGTDVIVWGGASNNGTFSSGGRYNPATDTWTPTASRLAPTGRGWHSAVWTGNLMVVFGGIDGAGTRLNTGGRYDPIADNWTPTATLDAPSPRRLAAAVWTGSLVVVWGGSGSATGGRYDPANDTWTPTSMIGAPSGREGHTGVWTGTELIVWGGSSSTGVPLDTGGRYNPASDTWVPTSMVDAPVARRQMTAVWTGTRMIVWGGSSAISGTYLDSGGRYDPATDAWSPTSTLGAPDARRLTTSVWTGTEMLVWGGFNSSNHGSTLATGGRYDPVADLWTPITDVGAPTSREDHTAIWTDHVMVVWGGSGEGGELNPEGARYDPALDTWNPTSVLNAPSGRDTHSGVWTGSEMIVWGGAGSGTPGRFNTGGRYAVGASADLDADGYSLCEGDCDDTNAAIHPGGVDLPGDSIDQDCSGSPACSSTDSWRSRGMFLRCVARACGDLVEAGLLTPQQCDALVGDAARLDVIQRTRIRPGPTPEGP